MTMPNLTDARRLMRLALAVNEIRQIYRIYTTHAPLSDIPVSISSDAFKTLGGKARPGKVYSLHRQLLHAKLDASAYAQRRVFPSSSAIKMARSKYTFYESDEEELYSESAPMRSQCDLARVAFVLARFEEAVADHPINSDEARLAVCSIRLTKQEFVQCGGKASVATDTRSYSFGRQIVGASRDIRRIIQTGKCTQARKEIAKAARGRAGIGNVHLSENDVIRANRFDDMEEASDKANEEEAEEEDNEEADQEAGQEADQDQDGHEEEGEDDEL